MSKVICNSIDKNDECKYCGAAQPHYEESCEPCPFVKSAKCVKNRVRYWRDLRNEETTELGTIQKYEHPFLHIVLDCSPEIIKIRASAAIHIDFVN